MKSSTRSVRFSCVCHFCLRFPDIRSRLEKNSKPKNFICIVRILFFTFLTKMFRRKPIIFWSKSRNKHQTDYSSKAKHFSSQSSSKNVEYCFDKAVEIVSPISKRILINDQKKTFYNFSIKKSFSHQTFHLDTFIWQSWQYYFLKIEIFFARIPNWIETFYVSFERKSPKMILWTSKMLFGEPCWKISLELGKILARQPKRKTEINCFQKHIFSPNIVYLNTEKNYTKLCWKLS